MKINKLCDFPGKYYRNLKRKSFKNINNNNSHGQNSNQRYDGKHVGQKIFDKTILNL